MGRAYNGLFARRPYAIPSRAPPDGGRLQRFSPSLPGCHSQGETEDEAIENIKIAIREYLEVLAALTAERFRETGIKEVMVTL